MSDLKTQPNEASVVQFIESVEQAKRQADAKVILQMMSDITGEKPIMWGTSIIGFGTYHYRYASGREGDWMRIGFSPRKANLSLYLMNGFSEYQSLLKKLGKYKTGKSCLYINKLEDIDVDILKQMIHHSFFEANLGVD